MGQNFVNLKIFLPTWVKFMVKNTAQLNASQMLGKCLLDRYEPVSTENILSKKTASATFFNFFMTTPILLGFLGKIKKISFL